MSSLSSSSSSSAVSLLFFVACFAHFLLPAAPYPFSTIAISRVSNVTLVCALVRHSDADPYDLNCTSILDRRQEKYRSGDGSYSAIAAGDGFLCGLTVPVNDSSNATMMWWEFDGGKEHSDKRVYHGEPLTALESSDTHVCGLIGSRHEPRCWRWKALQVPTCQNFSEIAVGRNFVCGLLDGGVIRCFGSDKTVVGKEPVGNFTIIGAGARHACGVSTAGKLCCWGAGAPGPDEIPLSSVGAMALGENKTCILRSDGKLYCLGEGAQPPGDLADKEFLSIEAMGDVICGITYLDFSVVCWGNEQLRGNHTIYKRALPGSCAPITSCTCDVMPGSFIMCPAEEGICLSCKLQFKPNSPPPPTLSPSFPANTSNPTTTQQKSKEFGKGRRLAVILGSAGAGIILLALLITIVVVVRRKKEGSSIYNRTRLWRPPATEAVPRAELASSSQLSSGGIEEFPLRALLKATENFSETHKVGSGGFGTVYRATLPDGRDVAIKRAHLPVSGSSSSRYDRQRRRDRELQRAFASEIALLSRINHKNLVRLLGFCQERRERILVYEYMSNGTLFDHLHKYPIEPSSPLGSWTERLRLALGAARGMEYLHVYAVPKIIHRDIKSSNILLDFEWSAKVSDFGVSLPSGPGEEAGAAAAGTVGYMDPEYYRLRRLTSKSDVYSFGVVLLELLTGHKAIYREEGEEGSGSGLGEGDDGEASSPTPRNLAEMAAPCIEADNLERILDRRLARPETNEEIEAVDYVAYLASECVKSESSERPTMSEVVGALERAVMTCDIGAGRDGVSRVQSMRSGFLERSGFIERSSLLLDPKGRTSGSGWLVRRGGISEEKTEEG